ncbi:MAG: hypothetical protein KAG53_11365 [Endozoicomonadaceae bacterium]|nr:hypothetical protein [Endozoicomonadaceae bacterium]
MNESFIISLKGCKDYRLAVDLRKEEGFHPILACLCSIYDVFFGRTVSITQGGDLTFSNLKLWDSLISRNECRQVQTFSQDSAPLIRIGKNSNIYRSYEKVESGLADDKHEDVHDKRNINSNSEHENSEPPAITDPKKIPLAFDHDTEKQKFFLLESKCYSGDDVTCEEIQKYGVNVKLLKLNNEQDLFAPLYNKENSCDGRVMTSVNAGDSSGCLGGTGINEGFKNILEASVKECDSKDYSYFHEYMVDGSDNDDEFELELFDERHHKNLCTAGVVHDRLLNKKNDHTGSVVIDVFKDESLPYGNRENRAMTYVYSPSLDDFRETLGRSLNFRGFCEAVRKTAANVIVATEKLNEYCSFQKLDTQVISVIRMSSFGTELIAKLDNMPSYFIKDTHKAIHKGIIDGLENTKTDRHIKLIQYPVEMGGVLVND